jgi:hypothetical protein
MMSTTEAQALVKTIVRADRTNDDATLAGITDGDVALALYVLETAKFSADADDKAFKDTEAERDLTVEEIERHTVAIRTSDELGRQISSLRHELYVRS